jgi:predicted ribosome quality control (RQC) complex YloA/Tae2 family protein
MLDIENKKIITEKLVKQMARALLRSIPLLPGPELYDIFDELRKSRTSLDRKVEQAATSLRETSDLISELESDLKERSEKIKILRDEIERYSKIAEVEEDKAKIILQEVQNTLNKGKNNERWVALGINLIAGILIFMLGIFVGPMLSKWLNQ